MNELYTNIEQLHKEISNIITPKSYIENDTPDGSGNNYAASKYMRYLYKKYFPTASWTIIEEGIYNKEILVAWKTRGTLTWNYGYIGYPEIVCNGSMATAHDVQYITDKKTNLKTNRLLDIGNDIKASNTDCWKKALNFHLNICDDIYCWEHPELSNKKIEEITKLAGEVNDKFAKTILAHIRLNNNEVNKENYEDLMNQLEVKRQIANSS